MASAAAGPDALPASSRADAALRTTYAAAAAIAPLVCRDAQLRSARRTYAGTWEWRPRRAVLLGAGGGEEGEGGGNPDPYGDAALILLFSPEGDGEGDGDLPSGAICLVPRSAGDGGGDGCGDDFRIAVASVPDHPLHVELQVLTSKQGERRSANGVAAPASDMPAGLYAGGDEDGPRRKKRLPPPPGEEAGAAGPEGREDIDACHAWRLKFPDEEIASLWRSALSELLSPRAEGGGGGTTEEGDPPASAPQRARPGRPADAPSGRGSTPPPASAPRNARSGRPADVIEPSLEPARESPSSSEASSEAAWDGPDPIWESRAGGRSPTNAPGRAGGVARSDGNRRDFASFVALMALWALMIVNLLMDGALHRALLPSGPERSVGEAQNMTGEPSALDGARMVDDDGELRAPREVPPSANEEFRNETGAVAAGGPLFGACAVDDDSDLRAPVEIPSSQSEEFRNETGAVLANESPSVVGFIFSCISAASRALRLAAAEATRSTADEERPPVRPTPLRRSLAALRGARASASASFAGFGGGGGRWHVWLALPAAAVLAVSAASILHRAFPRLGAAAPGAGRWCGAAALLAAAAAAAHDAWVNHLRHPLGHGLYWEGWARAVFATGCLGGGGVALKKALGVPPRRPPVPISAARKASAGLSAVLASLAAPLALRSAQERGGVAASAGSSATAGAYAALSGLAFFVGLYFFGRAMRRWTVGGVEVGRAVHEASLLPARLGYWILWVGGDVAHVLCRFVLAAPGRLVQAFRKATELISCALSWLQQIRRTLVYLWKQYFVPSVERLIKKVCEEIQHARKQICLVLQTLDAKLVQPSIEALVKAKAATSRLLIGFWQQQLRPGLLRVLNGIQRMLLLLRESVRTSLQVVHDRVLLPLARAASRTINAAGRSCRAAGRRLLQCLDSLCRIAGQLLDSFVSGVFKLGKSMLSVFRAMLQETARRVLLPLMRAAGRTINAAGRCCRAVGMQLLQCHDSLVRIACRILDSLISGAFELGKWTLSMLDALLRAAARTLLNVPRWLSRIIPDIAEKCFDCLVSTCRFVSSGVQRVHSRFVYPAARLLCEVSMAAASVFVKKLWQLGAAALVFNASYRFAVSAIVTSAEGTFTQIRYILGSWSLFLIGYTVAQAVLSSQGSIVEQYVAVEDSILRYVDFHLGYALFCLLASGWHVLSVLLRLLLHSADVAIRETFRLVWNCLALLHGRGAKPLLRFVNGGLLCVWNSPYFSMLASLATLCSIYLHHEGVISVPASVLSWTAMSDLWLVDVVTRFLVDCYNHLRDTISSAPGSLPVRMVTDVYTHVYGPIIEVKATSPSIGLGCWVFLSLVKWTQNRVRIKLFAAPVVFLYIMEATGLAAFRAFFVSYFIWVFLSFVVGRYESEQMRLATIEFNSFQDRRQARRSSVSRLSATEAPEDSEHKPAAVHLAKHQKTAFDQLECCICLDPLATGTPAELPCGHQFHQCCMKEWLGKSCHKRCPICRRATGGMDRVLEVVF